MRLAFIIVLISVNNVSGYKPVVLLHGILSAHEEMEVLAGYITSSHPGTVVHNIAMYEDSSSADTSMWTQLNGIVEKMKPVLTDPNGVHMICHSQGLTSQCLLITKLIQLSDAFKSFSVVPVHYTLAIQGLFSCPFISTIEMKPIFIAFL